MARYKKGESGNPRGRPKGAVSPCTKAKNDYFLIYEKMGGLKGFEKWLKENPEYKPDFFLKVLPGLMPKRTDVELSGKDSGPVEFTNTEIAVKIAYILDKAIKRMQEAEQKEIGQKV